MRSFLSVLVVIVTIITSSDVNAQCWKVERTISTDWRLYNGSDEFPNDFDWTTEYYDMYLVGSPYLPNTEPVVSPFYVPSSTLYQDNIYHFQSFSDPATKDFHPEDGWELIHKEFGVQGGPSNAVEYPFLALYNKYRGILRVFLMIRNQNELQTSAAIKISFPSGVTKNALFQHIKPISKSVKDFDYSLDFNTPNRYANYNNYWLHTDISVAYDPCTCENLGSSISKVEFNFSLISTTTLDINGVIDGNTIVDNVYSNSSQTINSNQVSIGPYSFDIESAQAAINTGQRYYKEYEQYGNQINSWLDDQNNMYKERVIKDWYLDKYGVSASQSTMNTAFTTTLNTPEGKKELFGISLTDPLIDGVKTATSIIPWVGMVWGLVDYFNSGGREDKVNNNPVQEPPISIFSSVTLSGQLETVNPMAIPTIYTPGTKSGQGTSIPKWNNILGVVNIMEMPSLIYDSYTPMVQGVGSWTQVPLSTPEVRQFRMEEGLKVALNPASGLKIISAEAAFVLEYEDDFYNVFDLSSPLNTPMLSDYMTYQPLVIGDLAILQGSNLIGNWFKALERMGFFQEFIHSSYGISDSKLRLRTEYVPLGALKELSFPLIFNTSTGSTSLKIPKVYVKVVYRLLPINETVADRNPIILVHSYEMDEALQNSSLNTTGTYNAYSSLYTEEIEEGIDLPFFVKDFSNLIHPNPNMASSVTSSGYTSTIYPVGIVNDILFADKINFHGNGGNPTFQLQNGGALLAKKQIWVENGVELLPNSQIYLAPVKNPFDVDDIYADEESILSVCNSVVYKESTVANKRDIFESLYFQIPAEKSKKIELSIFPNPAVNLLNIHANVSYDFIEIVDMNGRIVLRTGTISNEVDISVFSSGLYIIKIFENNELLAISKFEKHE